MIQLRKLSVREGSPAFRGASDIAETKEQVPDFSQCKAELTRTLNDCQPVKRCGVVSSLPAHASGAGQQSDSLVISNRGCSEPNFSRHLGNCQFGHEHILDQSSWSKSECWQFLYKTPLALKSALSCSVMDTATKCPELFAAWERG